MEYIKKIPLMVNGKTIGYRLIYKNGNCINYVY